MEKKILKLEGKQIDQGEGKFKAVFATLNVVDHDGDIILPGAIEPGKKIRISAYNHGSWGGNLPVGKGVISESMDKLVVDGEFFLDTQSGLETYKTIKNLEDLTEYSFGFDIDEMDYQRIGDKNVRLLKKLNVYEVSPVLLGAGIGTGTVDIKSVVKNAIPSHETDVVDEAWDAGAQVKKLVDDGGYSVYRNMFAWYDKEGDLNAKSTYKFPHHMVDEDGMPGPANMKACIAALNGARGGADIPEGERKGVWNHLAKHIKDGGGEPPELKEFVPETFADHASHVLDDVAGLVKRCQDIVELRQGKGLGKSSVEQMVEIKGQLKELADLIQSVVDEDDVINQEYLKFIARSVL